MPRPYTVSLAEGRAAFLSALDAFVGAVSDLDDHALLGASRAHGWSRVDCVVHVRAGLQELMAGIPATTDAPPEVDAASYWTAFQSQAADDPVPGILTTRRVASSYPRPTDALAHLREVAAGLRALVPSMQDGSVFFQGHPITAGDLLATWAVELVVHQHDLDAPESSVDAAAAAIARRTAEALHDNLGGGDDLTVALRGFERL